MALHDLPKLGVAATVEHLEVAPDPDGAVYFHNVRVNGILPRAGDLGIWGLLALLNSRVLDYCFRRGAAEHANGHYAANKQFIAPLPIRVPGDDSSQRLEGLSRRLSELTRERNAETKGFRDWLSGLIGTPLAALSGHTALDSYESMTADAVLGLIRRNRRRVDPDVDSRSFAEQLMTEHSESLEKLGPLDSEVRLKEAELEAAVFDLYGMTSTQRSSINAEYGD
jgi:hypothetical protein